MVLGASLARLDNGRHLSWRHFEFERNLPVIVANDLLEEYFNGRSGVAQSFVATRLNAIEVTELLESAPRTKFPTGLNDQIMFNDVDDRQERKVEEIVGEALAEHRLIASPQHLEIESDDIGADDKCALLLKLAQNLDCPYESTFDAENLKCCSFRFQGFDREAVDALRPGIDGAIRQYVELVFPLKFSVAIRAESVRNRPLGRNVEARCLGVESHDELGHSQILFCHVPTFAARCHTAAGQT